MCTKNQSDSMFLLFSINFGMYATDCSIRKFHKATDLLQYIPIHSFRYPAISTDFMPV